MKPRFSFFSILIIFTLLLNAPWAQATGRVEIILDVSGSMAAQAGTMAKMEAAKQAVLNTIKSIPEDSQVALRLYGHRIDKGNKAKSCQDSELVIPFGPSNLTQWQQALSQIAPRGQTPIAYSLQQAAKDFEDLDDETAAIVLVSDGAETCGGDPVAVAKELIAQDFEVQINTIGFDVDAAARAQLEAISKATGGRYLDAKDSAGLSESLETLTQASLVVDKSKAVYGEPIRGGDAYESAVAIKPDKLYRLDHHQKKSDFDYFYVDMTDGQKLVLEFETGQKSVSIRNDQAKEGLNNPYAGAQIHSSQRQKVVGDVIIGSANQKKQMNVPVGHGQGGRFYVLVGNTYADQHKDHPFKVSIQEQFDAGTKKDAGETEATAITISPGDHKAYLGPNDRTDMYRFKAEPGVPYTIKARDTDGKIKFRMILIDADGVKLQTKDSPNEGAAAKIENFALPAGGDVFVSVASYWSQVPESDYDLSIHAMGKASISNTSADQNNITTASPKPISNNNTTTKTIIAKATTQTNVSGVQNTKELCSLVGGLPFLEKAKLYGTWVGIPLIVGWLIGMIWGYLKGRKSGRKKVSSSIQ